MAAFSFSLKQKEDRNSTSKYDNLHHSQSNWFPNIMLQELKFLSRNLSHRILNLRRSGLKQSPCTDRRFGCRDLSQYHLKHLFF